MVDFFKDILNIELPNNKQDNVSGNKVNFIYLFSWIIALLLPIFILLDVVSKNYLPSVIKGAGLAVVILNILVIKTSNKLKQRFYYFNICALGFLFLLFFLVGDADSATRWWILAFPIIAVFFLEGKNGTVAVFVVLALSILISFLPFEWNKANLLLTSNKVELFLSFIVVYVVSRLYTSMMTNEITESKKLMREYEEDLKVKEDFISKLSHQIRTPLNNIMVTNNLILSTKLDDDQKDLIETIQASTNNLVNVVNNIS